MSVIYCEITDPPTYTEGIEHWTRETDADGEAMGELIELLVNNDHYLKQKAERANHVTPVSLPASGWAGSAAPYTQTVAVEGLTAEDNPVMVKAIADGATPEQVKAYNKAFGMIDDGDTADGQATFRCFNKKPAVDMTVGLKGV